MNKLLTTLVDYLRSGVVFVAAANLLDKIDSVIRRPGRFDFVFEVPDRDLPARVGLLRIGINKADPSVKVETGVVEFLAKRWNGFNTATLLATLTAKGG